MIAKAIKGRGFRGAADYDITKEKGEVIDSNMAGKTPRQLAKEFGEVRRLRPQLQKAVLHVSVSAAPGERLSNEQWREIGRKYLDGMGFKDNQYVVTRHRDTDCEHIHILANRITHGGQVVSDSQDYRRHEVLMREIERDYGLRRVGPSAEAMRKAPTKGEIERHIRTGEPSGKERLQQLCDAAAAGSKTYTDYQQKLEAAGVEVVPVAQQGGAKLSGISYRMDGVTMKGSDLGKGYTAAGIQKRGISYEQDRDHAAVRSSNERDATRAFGPRDGDAQAGAIPERGRDAGSLGAAGAGDGGAGGRVTPDANRDRQEGLREREGVSGQHGQGHRRLPERADRSTGGHTGLERSGPKAGDYALRDSGGNGPDYSDAGDRIVALAAGSRAAAHSDRFGGAGAAFGTGVDRSLAAADRQAKALGSDRFEVGIRDAKTGQMMNRNWGRDEIAAAGPWLKRMNARGNDIYVRPAGQSGTVLVDDLKASAIEQMKADGYAPAAVIETSPGNYQAWVKLSDKPLSDEVRKAAAHGLAKKYGGDMNSADGKHYGRLAGFTNQKPQHTRDGRQPYVLAHACSGDVAAKAPEALQRIEQGLDRGQARAEAEKRLQALSGAATGTRPMRDPVREYQRQAAHLVKRYGEKTDFSRVDWMVAKDMARQGFSSQAIQGAIVQASPNVESRKAGHMEDYAARTAERAEADPEVVAARQAERAAGSERAGRDRGGFER